MLHIMLNTIWTRVPDFVGGSRDLLLNYSQLLYPQLLEVWVGEEEEDNIADLRVGIGLVHWWGIKEAEAFDEDLVPALSEQAVAF